MAFCLVCQQVSVKQLLDFGHQPISNRFLKVSSSYEFTHPLKLGICENCCLVQLLSPPAHEEIRAHYDWIFYNEPEGHLDEVASRLSELPGLKKDGTLCGISGKENSLLKRLQQKGFTKTWEINCQQDLGNSGANAGIETIQNELTCIKSEKIVAQRGAPQLVIARHILEHAQNPVQMMAALQKLVAPEGYIVIEVPDCTKILNTYEYSAIWEEHTCYFTPKTFLQTLQLGGFKIIDYKNYPYAMENCMVAIVQVGEAIAPTLSSHDKEQELSLAHQFAAKFSNRKNWYLDKLIKLKQQGDLTLLGAGHLACHFINLFSLKPFFDFIIDDHPHKKGLLMPGSQLPIVSSQILDESNIKTCLLSLNQESEKKLMAHKQNFINKGGTFLSIFSTSPLAIR